MAPAAATVGAPAPTAPDRVPPPIKAVRTPPLPAKAVETSPATRDAVPLPVKAVLGDERQTTVVVDLTASTRAGPRSAEVDGRAAELAPLMSDGLAVTVVVDTTGGAEAPAWLSAAARFVLEAPAAARVTLIGEAAPAEVVAAPHEGPAGIVAALDGLRGGGRRDTANALELAARQFPDVPAGRKLAVVYTGAADAGGPSATALAERFRTAGVILVVATTARDSPYWTAATEATGGFFAPAGQPVVVPALDQIATTLRGRYLVRFPTPDRAVPLRVTTPDLALTAEVSPSDPDTSGFPLGRLLIATGTLGLLVAGALIFWARARRQRRPPPIVIAHGRAAVPPPARSSPEDLT
ncbi:hypothetical protein AB0J83_44930 [Actinoplanes sp. NPDC049596]|uniref:hypothetical protein n=1 Tax=unclassified Actinoplanes TaxID=2626549 RepID=UPI00341CAD6D